MDAELLLFSYVLGLVPIFYGLYIVIAGRVYLTSLSKEPVRGTRARLLGFVSLVMAWAYYTTITWAWSVYDR
jgi:hypothetical protein